MTIRIYRKQDKVFAKAEDRDEMAVKLVRIRPVEDANSALSLLGEKEEYAMLQSLSELDAESRRVAEEELGKFYLIPVVRRIYKAEAHFGTRYIDVETDAGRREFCLKNPYVSIRRVGKDGYVLRDVIGNLFRIPSLSQLDAFSRKQFERIT